MTSVELNHTQLQIVKSLNHVLIHESNHNSHIPMNSRVFLASELNISNTYPIRLFWFRQPEWSPPIAGSAPSTLTELTFASLVRSLQFASMHTHSVALLTGLQFKRRLSEGTEFHIGERNIDHNVSWVPGAVMSVIFQRNMCQRFFNREPLIHAPLHQHAQVLEIPTEIAEQRIGFSWHAMTRHYLRDALLQCKVSDTLQRLEIQSSAHPEAKGGPAAVH